MDVDGTVIVTGGLGFIGHHLVEHLHRRGARVVVLDKCTYASQGLSRLRDAALLWSPRVRVFTHDLAAPLPEGIAREVDLASVRVIFHLAADTHVDRSIARPVETIQNNVMSTVGVLELARRCPALDAVLVFSTDEVFGPAAPGVAFKEWDRHRPTNPYSASKSAGEQIALAYENTYGLPVTIVNVMNVFGERQHVEKFIPKVMAALRTPGAPIEVHADPTATVPGSRFYIHARNVADALLFVLALPPERRVGDKFNIRGEQELDNLQVVRRVAALMGVPDPPFKLVNFHADRPGHDLRYALDGTKLSDLGWEPSVPFDDSLRKVVQWTLAHPEWLEP